MDVRDEGLRLRFGLTVTVIVTITVAVTHTTRCSHYWVDAAVIVPEKTHSKNDASFCRPYFSSAYCVAGKLKLDLAVTQACVDPRCDLGLPGSPADDCTAS